MALRKWQCPKASLYATERSFQLVGLVGLWGGAEEVITSRLVQSMKNKSLRDELHSIAVRSPLRCPMFRAFRCCRATRRDLASL